MKINKFEELDSWKQARILVNAIYRLTKEASFSKDFRLVGQITGAVVSIMNNIAEGFDSQSNKEFVRFLRIARRSVSEVQNCLYIASDQKYILEKDFNSLYGQAIKVRQLIDGMIRYLKTK